ncbi:hypothetical protein PR003_g12676 [Phytophthora rubi]|uniref:Uncharacterized protein n=1 Tax=Phytophthora rubi TaxID=129364 RepID=A0A6A4EZI7_9STRA|nr:hypothetical protein PF003_g40751 [Phytophthora fragariae]KAE9336117.1 hypothetical protein PR003_g12676 [Phytophthora rubi]
MKAEMMIHDVDDEENGGGSENGSENVAALCRGARSEPSGWECDQ